MKIENSEITKRIVNLISGQTAVNKLPTQLANTVVPVIDVNPDLAREVNFLISNSRSTSGTLSSSFASTASRSYFLTGITVGYAKDAACDLATGNISVAVTPDYSKSTTTIVQLPVITLTADSKVVDIIFETPLRVVAGSAITMTGDFGAGVLVKSFQIRGYYVDGLTQYKL